ncbi:MAG: diaminopimelate epimerase [Cytophagales bacterium]|nr:diaminopimelate epimerase [Cytophagales bacterium]
MRSIPFLKYEGTGNDFILIKSPFLESNPQNLAQAASKLCHRQWGIGGDGFLYIRNDRVVDYYNADGSQGFCLNGARCVVDYMIDYGIQEQEKIIFNLNGISIEGGSSGKDTWVQMLSAPQLEDLSLEQEGYLVRIGDANHLVKIMPEGTYLSYNNVLKEGQTLRQKKNVNVNFLWIDSNKNLLRTYERGVENETLSCGTGAIAAALVLAQERKSTPPFVLHTKGGVLQVSDNFSKLSGKIRKVFSGEIVNDFFE